jgi:hypothetical protein
MYFHGMEILLSAITFIGGFAVGKLFCKIEHRWNQDHGGK